MALKIQRVIHLAILVFAGTGPVLASEPQAVPSPGETMRLERLAESYKRPFADNRSLPGWLRQLEVSALLEIEASHVSPYTGESTDDLILATAELGLISQLNDWLKAGVSALYEQYETNLEVDTAYLKLANAEASPFSLTGGQLYVPFGMYETNLVSDPLTLELGETRQTALQFGVEQSLFSGSLYVFKGDNKVKSEDRIGGWGAMLAVGQEDKDRAWSIGTGYINDLGDSDTLQDVINDQRVSAAELDPGISIDPTDRTPGWTVNALAHLGPLSLYAEYLSATEDFDPLSLGFKEHGARPAAWNLEVGYSFSLYGHETTAAVAYQGTREALALELPRERWLLGWRIGLIERVSLGFEWAHDRDYPARDGGTGKSAETFTAQLAIEL
ncbi:LbtU family siderophore porin [Caldichromatium japonicum]|uniref:LbtU family siderophore porin n=1 Tax=Caldichromatium japonicum TaxID=2699430 RepID=A0A6G7VF51_9GAMM|nr:LbtU family siderophore porin [Caldichromatium japonicum]QIK38505.1 LbtU family siderophore porin [Caldichromatium japonicum]